MSACNYKKLTDVLYILKLEYKEKGQVMLD